MALWNRSSYLMIARLIPIVLVLSAGAFWKYEKQIRLQTEKRLRTVSDQLVRSQADLADSRREAETAGEEKRFLIQQLGERDEHIRRLLAEMIRLLSGSGSVDLGEVLVRTQAPGAWDGVHQEMRNIAAQNPIGGIRPTQVPSLAPVAAPGLGQMQVEQMVQAPMPVQAAAISGPSPAKLFQTLESRGSQILTVNGQHRFVVISQGSNDGLEKDAVFEAFSGDQRLGRLKVGTVYERISTASILDGDAKQFREGSSIRLEPASA